MSKKVLVFEGAGHDKADSSIKSGVGNCRIRTRFQNKEGRIIYLEMGGFEKEIGKGKNKTTCIPAHVDHLFYADSEWEARRNCSPELSSFIRVEFEYNKENILKYVNDSFECNFESVEVVNDNSILVHDTKEPLCSCCDEVVKTYQDQVYNMSMLEGVAGAFKKMNQNYQLYKLDFCKIPESIKQYLTNYMSKDQLVKMDDIKIHTRWDNQNNITCMEMTTDYGCFGVSIKDVGNIIKALVA